MSGNDRDSNVYFTVFGGRKSYLSVLRPYVEKLVEQGTITEVHLWVFTTNAEDIQTMREWTEKGLLSTRCVLMYPPNPHKKWEYYYDYYFRTCKETDTVVKCDDDIVFIDCASFVNFLKKVDGDKDRVWFPNIVNNDVCAYFQQLEGVHALMEPDWMKSIERRVRENVRGDGSIPTRWFSSPVSASAIHDLFLGEAESALFHGKPLGERFIRDKMCEYGNRISINCFAVKGRGIQRFFGYMRGENVDDEGIVGNLPALENTMHKVDMSCVVVHFQFAPQDPTGWMRERYLGRYAELAKNIQV